MLASAYAGRCGLDLLSLATKVADGTEAGSTIFTILLGAYKGATVSNLADCVLAEQTMTGLGTGTSLSSDENILLAFVEFAKIGTVLAQSGADADHDGVVDGSFNACTNDADNITDADVQQIGTGLTLALDSIVASSASVAGDAVNSMKTVCATIDTFLSTTGFCDQFATTDFDAMEILGLRSLLKSSEIGLNTCGGTLGTGTCHCP
jgi:hypothetical protein